MVLPTGISGRFLLHFRVAAMMAPVRMVGRTALLRLDIIGSFHSSVGGADCEKGQSAPYGLVPPP